MATLPGNYLQNVETFQRGEMAEMLNSNVAMDVANKKFKNFEGLTAQLGDKVLFDLPPRATFGAGLVISTTPSKQIPHELVCSQAGYTATQFKNQDLVFNNVDEYMDKFGRSRIAELGANIEADILTNFISQVRVNDPESADHGNILDPTSGPFNFYGDGTTPINSYVQLAEAQANFIGGGAAQYDMMGILPVSKVPSIIENGLSKFTTNRGNENADTWEFAKVGNFSWKQSNLLPIHNSGTVGDQAQTLTLVSTNDPTGRNITQLTFSGATANDQNAFKVGDLCKFNDSVGSLPNMRRRTWIGHKVTTLPVQFRILNDAAANGSGNVTVDIYPALCATSGVEEQNINVNLQAGMQIFTVKSHQAGIIMSGNPLYLAMPALETEDPFNTKVTTDEGSGCSIRHYWGSVLGANRKIYAWDAIWGSTLVARNCHRVCFPL